VTAVHDDGNGGGGPALATDAREGAHDDGNGGEASRWQ